MCRSYCGAENGLERRSCQTTQYHLLRTLIVAAAPILPHLMEEVHQHMPEAAKTTGKGSIATPGRYCHTL